MRHCIFIFIFFHCLASQAQQIILTPDFVESWKVAHPFQGYYHPNVNRYYTGLILASVYDYNNIQRKLGLTDTIAVYKKSNFEFDYRVNDVLIKDNSDFGLPWLSIPGYQPDIDQLDASYEFTVSGKGGEMNSTYLYSDSTYYAIRTSFEDEFKEDLSIKINFFTHGFLDGRSEHFTESGRILYKGHYMLKDTMYRDTVVELTDWSERILVHKRLYVSKKCGTWTENIEGDKVENIEYPACPENRNK